MVNDGSDLTANRIKEFAGRFSSAHENVSIARIVSPGDWDESEQQPEFEEITVVLRGSLLIESDDGVLEVRGGPAVIARGGELLKVSRSERFGSSRLVMARSKCGRKTQRNGNPSTSARSCWSQ